MTDTDKADLRNKLIERLVEDGILCAPEPMPENQGYHCSGCSCTTCRNYHEDCACENNWLLEAINDVLGEGS